MTRSFTLPDNDDLENNKPQQLSTGQGRTTCSYFLPGDKTIVYASTHLGAADCPKEPERKPGGKYLWPVYDTYDIFVADGKKLVFSSNRNNGGTRNTNLFVADWVE